MDIRRLAKFIVVFAALSAVLFASWNSVQAADDIEFHRDIRPLLSENCFACHGPDHEQREADLRLDIRAGAFAAASEGGKIIVPSQSDKSELVVRITSSDEDIKMPPPDSGHELSTDEIALIQKWIEQGADWEDHWSFVPAKKVRPPNVSKDAAKRSVKHPIDKFIVRRLEKDGLALSPAADRRALIRRLSLDLIGLPPTPEEINAFLADKKRGAYARLVDRLLASPHFGERMTVAWLDQARYADTNGYSIDGGRHMWLWRDWVIDAYNKNMPFDQFAIEQLAGDLLPDATAGQKIASGFNRNHMITHEGGTISEENLVNYTVDRVKTTSEVFLGLTMGCAQCHDHKYDPITQRDFYRFFAFFNTLSDKGHDGDGGRNSSPKFKSRTVLAMESAEQLNAELESLEKRLATPLASQSAWEASARESLSGLGRGMKLQPCSLLGVTEPNSRGALQIRDDDIVFVPGGGGRSPSISAKLPAGKVTALRLEFLPDDAFPEKRSGHGNNAMKGGFILTGFHASTTTIPSAQVDPYGQLKIRNVTASYSHPDFPAEDCLDGRDFNGWSPYPKNDRPQSITFELAQPLDASQTPFVTVHLVWGGAGKGGRMVGGKYRILAVTGENDQSEIPTDIRDILAVANTGGANNASAARSKEQRDTLRKYYNSRAPELAETRYQIRNLRKRIRVVADEFEVMVMNTAEKPRKTYMLNRGQYDQRGEEVTAGVPSFLPVDSFKEAAATDRLALAKWITGPNHPLTSRVAVNRLWQNLFGNGLVATSADFGSQGEFPSHPELLDWLSRDFVNHGWDVKRTIRLIVLSKTYRQTSRSTAKLTELDPNNRLLARGPRFRLQAEFVRDLALSVSNVLSPRIGGPSVRPYQPPGLWKEISHYGSTGATSQLFVQDHGENLYRRSMYTYWKRTAPPPSLTVFDAPNREVCTVRRSVTNTPLQALVLLNDPQYVEASRVLAERMMTGADKTQGRIKRGFELVLGRLPSKEEVAVLRKRLQSEKKAFAADPRLARKLLSVGEANRNGQLDPVEHAAWTTIANLILNLSEAITRG